MLTLMLSEKFYTQSLDTDLSFTNSNTELQISNLANIQPVDGSTDIIILDLDFDKQTSTDGDTIPLFGSDLGNARNIFNGLPNSVPRFLNDGGVLITLLAERVDTFGLNQPTNYDWLDELDVANVIECSTPRAPTDVVSNVESIHEYFQYINSYEYSIRLNPNVVSQPEILAKHEIDNETVAVALNKYSDPHGVIRQVSGNLILLPQPELTQDNSDSIIQSLVGIGEHFAQRDEVEDVADKDEGVDIELLLEKGEGETVEFKQQFPNSAHDMEKELVAFANLRGGTVVIGVNDNAGVVGVEDIDEVQNRVAGSVDNIQPPIEPMVESHTVDEKQVVSVTVDKKEAEVSAHSTSRDKTYRRVGPTCRSLSAQDIERLYL